MDGCGLGAAPPGGPSLSFWLYSVNVLEIASVGCLSEGNRSSASGSDECVSQEGGRVPRVGRRIEEAEPVLDALVQRIDVLHVIRPELVRAARDEAQGHAQRCSRGFVDACGIRAKHRVAPHDRLERRRDIYGPGDARNLRKKVSSTSATPGKLAG